jgi:adenine deaminase
MEPIDFELRKLVSLLIDLKQKLGRDPSLKELMAQGVVEARVKKAVQKGVVEKHKVSLASGQSENRYRVKKNFYALNP